LGVGLEEVHDALVHGVGDQAGHGGAVDVGQVDAIGLVEAVHFVVTGQQVIELAQAGQGLHAGRRLDPGDQGIEGSGQLLHAGAAEGRGAAAGRDVAHLHDVILLQVGEELALGVDGGVDLFGCAVGLGSELGLQGSRQAGGVDDRLRSALSERTEPMLRACFGGQFGAFDT
jgi:hypothetical protein